MFDGRDHFSIAEVPNPSDTILTCRAEIFVLVTDYECIDILRMRKSFNETSSLDVSEDHVVVGTPGEDIAPAHAESDLQDPRLIRNPRDRLHVWNAKDINPGSNETREHLAISTKNHIRRGISK